MRKALIIPVLGLVGGLAIAGCTSTSSSHASAARSAASAAASNPQVQSDLTAEQTILLNNLQKNFDPAHPVKSVETAVRLTFPKGNTAAISKYAVSTFTLAVLHTHGPGSARDKWLQGVVLKAQANGTPVAAPSATAPSGQANIPGIPNPSASKS